MDYFILGLWGTTLVVVCIILYKVNIIIKHIKEFSDYYCKRFSDVEFKINNNNIDLDYIKDLLKDNTNSILDDIAELTGTITVSGGKICKILDIVDAKDKAYIKATDTMKSEQSIKTRKAKNSSHSKKVTTIHCNKK